MIFKKRKVYNKKDINRMMKSSCCKIAKGSKNHIAKEYNAVLVFSFIGKWIFAIYFKDNFVMEVVL